MVGRWLGRRRRRRQDPEGILGAPQGGHIARLEFRRRLERDSEAREAFERQVREEKERRRSEREVSRAAVVLQGFPSSRFPQSLNARVVYFRLLLG